MLWVPSCKPIRSLSKFSRQIEHKSSSHCPDTPDDDDIGEELVGSWSGGGEAVGRVDGNNADCGAVDTGDEGSGGGGDGGDDGGEGVKGACKNLTHPPAGCSDCWSSSCLHASG